MKFFATFALFAIIAVVAAEVDLTNEQKVKAEALIKECLEETSANEDTIAAIFHGDFSQAGDKDKCFIKCFQTKLGYVSNGVVKSSVIQKALGPLVGEKRIKAIQAKCNCLKGSNDCDTAFRVHKCYASEQANLA